MKAPFLLFALFCFLRLSAQESSQQSATFIGIWCNAASGRELRIQADEQDSTVVLIFDRTVDRRGKQLGSTDSYRAVVKSKKLIMHASKIPRAPYCEINLFEGTLVYQCNDILDLDSNILTDTWVFSRCHK